MKAVRRVMSVSVLGNAARSPPCAIRRFSSIRLGSPFVEEQATTILARDYSLSTALSIPLRSGYAFFVIVVNSRYVSYCRCHDQSGRTLDGSVALTDRPVLHSAPR